MAERTENTYPMGHTRNILNVCWILLAGCWRQSYSDGSKTSLPFCEGEVRFTGIVCAGQAKERRVGPRLLMRKYFLYYAEEERVRHFVRPVLTWLAQANGKSHLRRDDGLLLDIKYVENLDLN